MEKANYLILILIWAMPVIILQWLIGIDVLLRRWKIWLIGIVIPTLYLTSIDSIALRSKTWTISPAQSTGIMIPVINVPLEEGIFFLVTNTLVVQGLIFLMARVYMFNRVRRLLRIMRRGPQSIPTEIDES